MAECLLRICTLGNANSVAVQIRTRDDILFHQRPELSPRRRRATIDVLEIADGVVSRSDYMLAEYPRLQAKAMVTRWGVDLDLFSSAALSGTRPLTRADLGLADNTPLILSPRRIVPVCGIASIVEALTRVRERVSNAVLLLINDQPDPAYRHRVLGSSNSAGSEMASSGSIRSITVTCRICSELRTSPCRWRVRTGCRGRLRVDGDRHAGCARRYS